MYGTYSAALFPGAGPTSPHKVAPYHESHNAAPILGVRVLECPAKIQHCRAHGLLESPSQMHFSASVRLSAHPPCHGEEIEADQSLFVNLRTTGRILVGNMETYVYIHTYIHRVEGFVCTSQHISKVTHLDIDWPSLLAWKRVYM